MTQAKIKYFSFFKTECNQRGGTAVEFGILLPVFLILIFAVIEYGWYFTNEIVLENAVAEGARRAIKEDNNADAQTAAIKAVQDAFWIGSLGESDEIENIINIIIPEDEPKRIIVSVPIVVYKQITGFLPSKIMPDTLGAKAVMTFP